MRPDKSSIIEATVDMREATVKSTDMPSGATLLTLASPDKSFECHLNVGMATTATLGLSPKTGGPIVRISDGSGVICTVSINKDSAAAFGAIRDSLGDDVTLTDPAQPAQGDAPQGDAPQGCRLLTGEELELELTDMVTGPMIIDCFARWCGPCQLMAPVLEKVAQELGQRCRVVKFDTDEFPDMADRLRVQGLPTLLFVAAGDDGASPAFLSRFEGAAPADFILATADHHFFGGPPPPSPGLE